MDFLDLFVGIMLVVVSIRLYFCAKRNAELEGALLAVKALNDRIMEIDRNEEKNDV